MTVIDAHQHFWDLTRLDYPWLHHPAFATIDRSFTPDTLEPQLDEAGVDQTVVVQAADSTADTDYLLGVADRWNRVAGVVGWVPLLDPDTAEAEIERRSEHPAFVGVRHMIHDEADIDWVIQRPVLESLRRLARHHRTFDVVAVLPRHLEHVATIADAAPDLRIVIDHLAKPPIAAAEWEPWSELLAAAAARPNVYAKLSGLTTAAKPDNWDSATLQPYVDRALELFGPNRLMAGGDWPVAELTGRYAEVWQTQIDTLSLLSTTERDAVLGETAIDFYRLDP